MAFGSIDHVQLTAHPALALSNFEALLKRLADAGVEFRPSEEGPGRRRGHIDDCFGNRIELIDPDN